ncbi:MAG TPA: four helix bundle protein [Caulobacteraceae bacterium]|nr:four helix bundle protein [Caulobacteraceae bacterium]
MGVTSYRDLTVWRRAMELAEETYRVARLLPKTEEYRLTSQLVRAAVSVPANIAEGHARSGKREFLNFLSIAGGSLAETETLLLLAVRVGYVRAQDADKALMLAEEVSRMLMGLRKRLKQAPLAPNP